MVITPIQGTTTLEEYFEYEYQANTRHEFINGKIVPMSYTSEEHGLIVVNFISELHQALKGSNSRVYPSDRMLYVKDFHRIYYPDAMIVNGKSEFHQYKGKMKATINPVVLIEVLSNSTENIDRHSKWRCYKKLKSLQQYIMISQDDIYIETFNRVDDSTDWLNSDFDKLSDKILVNGHWISLSDIYTNIEF